MAAAFAHFRLVHELNRRVRIVSPLLRKDPERTYIFEILLRKRPEIKDVRAQADIGSVAVHFDPARLPRDKLLPLLDVLLGNLAHKGAPAEAPQGFSWQSCAPACQAQEINIAIEGMTCASCALLIELTLKRDPRVREANVSFAAGTATVVGSLGREEAFARISRLGYTPRPMDTLSQRRLVIERERERLADARNRMLWAGLLTLPVMALGMAMPRSFLLRTLQFTLSAPVVFWAGRPFFDKAATLAKQRAANMDTLIAMGAGAAYLYSTPAWLRGRHHLYFESASGIIFFVLLGRYLEEKARGRASEAIRRLIELQPQTATVIRDDKEIVVPSEEVVVGDILLVRPGERLPTDGEVIAGSSRVDESMVTGESLPVAKEPGSPVIGGCINGSGAFRMKAGAVGADTVLAGIVRMVDHAQAARLPVQKLADRVTGLFVPAVMGVAAITLGGWLLAGRSAAHAVTNAVAVLLIACPCSLGLATPTAIMAATGQAARRGIYIRNGESLENAARLTVIVFDKPGTITEGRPAVAEFVNLSGMAEGEILRLAASVEVNSEHFLGKAIVQYARDRGAQTAACEDILVAPGQGISGALEGHRLVIGNAALLEENGIGIGPLAVEGRRIAGQGRTPVFVALDGRAAALFAIADKPRPIARQTIARLARLGVRTVMVTGDTEETARHIAEEVGIADVVARASPERKLEIVRELREQGERV